MPEVMNLDSHELYISFKEIEFIICYLKPILAGNILLKWQKKNGRESYLKFDNLKKMIKQIGGNAQFIAFLEYLNKIKDSYLEYYNIIDLTPHFPTEEKSNVNAKNIIINL